MTQTVHDHNELQELLAGRVLGDLNQIEQQRLSQLLEFNESENVETELERAAAALQLALLKRPQYDMPPALRERIMSDATRYVADDRQEVFNSQVTSPQNVSRSSVREIIAWLVCAAAILVAVSAWLGNRTEDVIPLATAREHLISNIEDTVRVTWSPGKTPFENEVSGDVVWSNAEQIGFMRFVGMPVNDRSIEQYQLWIIDPDRDDEPIDGGVFDIPSTGEVLVPINPKLMVLKPVAFAITIEKPGGVVVSTQDRLPLLAKLN